MGYRCTSQGRDAAVGAGLPLSAATAALSTADVRVYSVPPSRTIDKLTPSAGGAINLASHRDFDARA